ncbi:MAG: hypothetical protein ACP5OZ_00415 [Candidatus Woesearchaeota archaeon]
MISTAERLRAKGWSDEEIARALEILNSEPKTNIPVFYKVLYWVALIAAIVGNTFVAIILVPLLILLQKKAILLVILLIIVLSLSFGALFNSLLKEIESLSKKTYVITNIFLPTLAFLNMFFISNLSNFIISRFELKNIQNPSNLALFYGFLFLSPFLISKVRETIKIII